MHAHVCPCVCNLPEENGGKCLLGRIGQRDMMWLNSNPRDGRCLGEEGIVGSAEVLLSSQGRMKSISSWTQDSNSSCSNKSKMPFILL